MICTVKLWERILEGELRTEVNIYEQQCGFMSKKSTKDGIFVLRMLIDKYRESQREVHCFFVGLEKA